MTPVACCFFCQTLFDTREEGHKWIRQPHVGYTICAICRDCYETSTDWDRIRERILTGSEPSSGEPWREEDTMQFQSICRNCGETHPLGQRCGPRKVRSLQRGRNCFCLLVFLMFAIGFVVGRYLLR